jgi:hypothetical protein
MRSQQLLLSGLMIAVVVGCRSVPFEEGVLVPVNAMEPELIRVGFASALPAKFRVVNTVSVEFRGQAFGSIGYTDVDTSERTFTVVGLHPAGGMKLFEVSGVSDQVECKFALEEFTRHGDVARMVGDDTRRMYFDRVPDPSAKVSRGKYRIFFRQPEADGELEYVFGGADGVLVEKRFYENGKRIWSASYYEYRRENGRLYPGGIVMEHHQYRYRLIVRLREVQS